MATKPDQIQNVVPEHLEEDRSLEHRDVGQPHERSGSLNVEAGFR